MRIECRGNERDTGQGRGQEAARDARGVPAPRWFAGVCWLDEHRQVMWRAVEIEYIDEQALGRAEAADDLSDSWWSALAKVMDQLVRCRTTRKATPYCEPITQERVVGAIAKAPVSRC